MDQGSAPQQQQQPAADPHGPNIAAEGVSVVTAWPSTQPTPTTCSPSPGNGPEFLSAFPAGSTQHASAAEPALDTQHKRMLMDVLEGCPHISPASLDASQISIELQERLECYTEENETKAAYPLLCELAVCTFFHECPKEARTVRALHRVAQNLWERGVGTKPGLAAWLLPRAVEHWGIDHPDTVQLVQHAALFLCESKDPSKHTDLTRIVTELAQQIPGGLGWFHPKNTVVAPVPDEEAYTRNAVSQARGVRAASQGHHKLAKQTLQECATYFESLGSHWLGVVRRAKCLQVIGACTAAIDGHKEAEPVLLAAKRTVRRELGPNHPATLDILW